MKLPTARRPNRAELTADAERREAVVSAEESARTDAAAAKTAKLREMRLAKEAAERESSKPVKDGSK